jgi:RimJ/RimL family protein N-acetyltransferase
MLVFGQDKLIADWVSGQLGWSGDCFEKYVAIGVARNSQLIAGIVYSEYRDDGDIRITIASSSPLWATRQNIRSLLHYPFIQLGCRRVTTITPKHLRRARKFLTGIGFKLEGVMREAVDGRDACIYGMLKHECKWLE